MLKNTSKIVTLISTVGVGILELCKPAYSTTLQTAIQETYIEGNQNQINQLLEQNLTIGLIYLPNLPNFIKPLAILDQFIQGNNNQVNQLLNQNFPPLSLENQPINYNPFLDNGNILDTVQFSTQEASIFGNNNLVTQNNEQTIIDFFFFPEEKTNNNVDFNELIEIVLQDNLLDGIQFSLQDVIIEGDNNQVEQKSYQTITNFLLVENDEINNNPILNPLQFAIQETFIFGDTNLVEQELTQTITDLFVLNDIPQIPTNPTEFDIDEFIDTILNNTIINANQTNQQNAFVEGNNNRVQQENTQVINTKIPENSPVNALLFFGLFGIILKLLK